MKTERHSKTSRDESDGCNGSWFMQASRHTTGWVQQDQSLHIDNELRLVCKGGDATLHFITYVASTINPGWLQTMAMAYL